MDPNVMNFLVSLAAGIGTNVSSAVFSKAFAKKPELEERLLHPASPTDFESAVKDLAGTLEALAGSGSINIDGSVISALRSARFDHQHGQVFIGNSVVTAPFLQTGGTGTGTTIIGGNTQLRSAGTGIHVGQGARIVITGDANIKQN